MMSPSAGKSLPIVLVVEDAPLLWMLAVEVVEEAGYTAIEARDADEAVVLLESRADIALLFTDIDMPGSIFRPISRRIWKALPDGGPGRGTSIDCRFQIIKLGNLNAGD